MNQQHNRNHCTATHWVGADVSKPTFDVGFVRCDQHYPATPLSAIPAQGFPRSPQGVTAFLAWLDTQNTEDQPVRVVMEATGSYSTQLVGWMLEQRPALSPVIANPCHTHAFIKSLGVRNKTDRLEARALGFYGVERNPLAYEPLTPERARLRELSRYRDSLVQQRTALKNQMKEPCACAFIQKDQAKRLKQCDAHIADTENQMRQLITQHENLNRDFNLLTSICGIAFLSATVILAELGDLRRFGRARQLSAFAGMSPRHYQSGASVHRRGRLCKQGNPRIRQSLYLSAMVAIRGNNPFQRSYQNLIRQGKPPMVALAAVMRKLLTVMRVILINEEPYDPQYNTCG